MGFVRKVKKARELAHQLKRVKQEMKEVEAGKGGLKVKARRSRELVRKLRDVQIKMNEWELGELGKEADKEGKNLDKLITLAEARERVTKAKISVREAKERLRRPKVKLQPGQKTKITFSVTAGRKKPAKLPRRKSPRITPPTPRLRR